MVKVGIVGISGYSGKTALEILLKHPLVKLTYVSANNTHGNVTDIWPDMADQTTLVCKKFDLAEAKAKCDILILAVPHTVSLQLTPDILKAKISVIDLSGDYRLDNPDLYEKWYKTPHSDASNLKNAVYGLPELYREDIKKAKLISNPGCYPTSAILGLAPIVSTHINEITQVIIDAKSGVSGAGKKVAEQFIFCEVNENFKAYKVLNHQHQPEIELYLSKLAQKEFSFNFVPHLLPITRGILSTIYVSLKDSMKIEDVHKIYERFYKTEDFVRVLKLGQQPELKNVACTNFCDIGLALSSDGKLLVITSAIDNLMKGASGQAIQNLNIMCGLKETEGLL